MKNLYVISGVTGMTGNELARQLVRMGHKVIGFDNFFASSLHTVEDIVNNSLFTFSYVSFNLLHSAMLTSISRTLLWETASCCVHPPNRYLQHP